jgi:hypothetical protein
MWPKLLLSHTALALLIRALPCCSHAEPNHQFNNR